MKKLSLFSFFAGERSDNGEYVFLSSEKKSCLFNYRTKKVIKKFSFSSGTVCFYQENVYILESNGTLHVYNLTTKRETHTIHIVDKKEAFWDFEGSICCVGQKVYFIGHNEKEDKYYCFDLMIQTNKIRKKEISESFEFLGVLKEQPICAYMDCATDETVLFLIQEEEYVPICRKRRIDQYRFLNGSLHYIEYVGDEAFSVSENFENNSQEKHKINREFLDVLDPCLAFDTNGENIAIVRFDMQCEKDKVYYYSISQGTIIFEDFINFAMHVIVMKDGFFCGGEKSYLFLLN